MSFKGNNNRHLDFSFERDFNLLYTQVNPVIKTGILKEKKEIQKNKVSNLAIYEIGSGKLIYFFEEGSINDIKHFFYENSYNEKLEKIDFNKEHYRLSNNVNIKNRKLANKLFVITEKSERKECELWISSKSGTNRRKINTFPEDTAWRIDVFNKKVLFVMERENKVEIESFDW